MAALIDLCNRALAQIAAGQIADFSEGSMEAREVSRFASPLLLEVADWAEWQWMIKRQALASVANDRPAEWLYAYAEPADLAQPLGLRQVEDDATDLPIAGPYPFPQQDAMPLAYLHEGSRIYANVPTATLIYARSTLEAGDMPPLVAAPSNWSWLRALPCLSRRMQRSRRSSSSRRKWRAPGLSLMRRTSGFTALSAMPAMPSSPAPVSGTSHERADSTGQFQPR